MPKISKSVIIVISIIGFLGLISFAVLYLFSSNARDNQNPVKQEEMMKLILEWGRLAPFPSNASNVSVETEGNSFTRSFQASFVAPQEEIQAWIKASPGLREATPEKLSDNEVKYSVDPSGGANKVEVTIDFSLTKVSIYASWS